MLGCRKSSAAGIPGTWPNRPIVRIDQFGSVILAGIGDKHRDGLAAARIMPHPCAMTVPIGSNLELPAIAPGMSAQRAGAPAVKFRTLTRCLSLLLIIATVCFWSASASAQSTDASVRLDGKTVFYVGPASEGDNAAARARRIEQRLSGLLKNLDALGAPIARQTSDGWAVTVSGISVVTVTARDAEDNLTTPPALAKQWAAALGGSLEQARERRLGWGGRFGAETRASAEAAFGRMADSAVRILPRSLAALLVILMFWLVARGVRGLLRLLFKRTVEDVTVESLIKQLSYYAILAVGFFVAVDALGFDPTTVAAGLGLTGIVLGFALKDILSNFVSGVLLLMLRPFKIGDQIVVGDLEGSVERIELRATRLRAYDGRVMLVPNAAVFTSRIINNTADPIRRGMIGIWLGYDVDLQAALEAIRQAIPTAAGVLDHPPPVVWVGELGQDDILVEATFWTDSRRADFKNTASAARAAILASLKTAGIPLPAPETRKVTLQNAPSPER